MLSAAAEVSNATYQVVQEECQIFDPSVGHTVYNAQKGPNGRISTVAALKWWP